MEVEGTSGDEDMGADEDMSADEDMGAEPGGDQNRYDPNVLFWRLYSTDWRDGAPVNAIGLNRPAIQAAIATFVDAIPGVANLTNMKEGGKAPYQFTAFRHALRYFFPPEASDRATKLAGAAVCTILVPRGIQFANFLGRGLYFLELNTQPVFQATPVDTIGAAGGYVILGGADAATAQNMGTSRRDGYPLPDQMRLSTGGPSITAHIAWCPADIPYLGAGAAGFGCGSPWPNDFIAVTSATGAATPPVAPVEILNDLPAAAVPAPAPLAPALVGISWEMWGRRGLNPRAGTMPRKGAPGRTRRR